MRILYGMLGTSFGIALSFGFFHFNFPKKLQLKCLYTKYLNEINTIENGKCEIDEPWRDTH